MKRLIVLTTALLFGASLAFGQWGMLGTYADMQGLECNVVDDVPGVLFVYIVHTLGPGATDVYFKATVPLCMTTSGVSWGGDGGVFPVTVGNSQTGVHVGYPGCHSSPIHVLTIFLFAFGGTSLCCEYIVDGHPQSASGEIEIVDCQGNVRIGTGLANTVNGDPSVCDCNVVSGIALEETKKETNWGAIKALYQ